MKDALRKVEDHGRYVKFRSKESQLSGRMPYYSPGARQRPMKPDIYRERKPIPSPANKPRMETYSYQEPERRPMPKPAYKMTPELRTTNVAVIEKRPVLFNRPTSVSDYPPLPQRNPVQRQPPKPGPQKPGPAQTVPRKPEPVKTIPQKVGPATTIPQKVGPATSIPQKVGPATTVPQKVGAAKTVPQKVGTAKTVPQTVEPAKTVPQKPEPAKAVPQKAEPAKAVPQKVEPAKTVPQKAEPAKAAPQKVEQVKTLPQKVEPVKSPQKPTVVQKQGAKPAQKQPEAQSPKPKSAADNKDVKPAENKASEPKAAPSVEPNPDGCYQLDPPTSDALEVELHQIMAKVSQALTKEATSDAERLVLSKINGIAGDDIKNALGLNVTKRLLNQHNPFYVKLAFSGKPEAGCLQAFIASRRISAFKRIATPGDTFAARLDAAQDFDRLCQAQTVTCGSAKVKVTPCYKFLACPSTVKTIYEVTNDDGTEKPDSINSSPQKQHNVEKSEESEAKTAEKNSKISPEDYSKKEVKTEISETKVVDQTEETKTEMPGINRKVPSNSVTVNITIEAHSKSDEVKNASKEIPKTEAKKETAKSEVNNKVTNPNNELNKANNVKDNSIEEMTVVDEHNDEEQMTDHDILALMSSGIVLDECSGSDDEE